MKKRNLKSLKNLTLKKTIISKFQVSIIYGGAVTPMTPPNGTDDIPDDNPDKTDSDSCATGGCWSINWVCV